MNQLEIKNTNSKLTKKLLGETLKLEKQFLDGLSEEKLKEYNKLYLKSMLYNGSEISDQIEFTINFILDLHDSMR